MHRVLFRLQIQEEEQQLLPCKKVVLPLEEEQQEPMLEPLPGQLIQNRLPVIQEFCQKEEEQQVHQVIHVRQTLQKV